jgi:hypothetical protein
MELSSVVRDTHGYAVAVRVAFAQFDMRKLRVGEHAVGHESIARAARSSSRVVPYNAEVIASHMSADPTTWPSSPRLTRTGHQNANLAVTQRL